MPVTLQANKEMPQKTYNKKTREMLNQPLILSQHGKHNQISLMRQLFKIFGDDFQKMRWWEAACLIHEVTEDEARTHVGVAKKFCHLEYHAIFLIG